MSVIDIVLGIILLLAFVSGFKKGLFSTLAALLGLFIGGYAAIYFSSYAGSYISNWFDWSTQVTQWVAFAVTFLAIVFLLNFLGRFMTKIADFTALGLLNKLLGGVLSAFQYAFIISVVFWFFSGTNLTGYVISEEKKESSFLYTPIAAIAPWILPQAIEKFKEFKPEKTSPEEETTQII